MKYLALSILILSFSINLALARENVDINIIMNAFKELHENKYSEEEMQQKLKAIIDNKEKFEGHKWEEFLQKIKSMKENPNISRDTIYIMGIAVVTGKVMVVNLLLAMTQEEYSKFSKAKKNQEGDYYFDIPKDIYECNKYLEYAIKIMEQHYDVLDDHPDQEDLEKLIANVKYTVDLYENALNIYIDYLNLYNKNSHSYKKKLREYKKAMLQYEIESQKVAIYIARKTEELSKKYSYNVDYSVEDMERAQMLLEKKYETH